MRPPATLPDLRRRAPVRRLERPAVDDARRAASRGPPQHRRRARTRPAARRHAAAGRHRPARPDRPDTRGQRDVGLRQHGRRRVDRGVARAGRAERHRHLAPALLREHGHLERGVRRLPDLHPRRRCRVGPVSDGRPASVARRDARDPAGRDADQYRRPLRRVDRAALRRASTAAAVCCWSATR